MNVLFDGPMTIQHIKCLDLLSLKFLYQFFFVLLLSYHTFTLIVIQYTLGEETPIFIVPILIGVKSFSKEFAPRGSSLLSEQTP